MSLDLEYFDKDDLSRGLLLSFGDDEDYISYQLTWDKANAIVSVIIAHREMMDAKERLGRIPELTPPGVERPEDVH
jgi:hypothetical protein|tara:strand:+ start:111 stop:338 length:228 start_codon:yes stop_codon:yes gene_type:complete